MSKPSYLGLLVILVLSSFSSSILQADYNVASFTLSEQALPASPATDALRCVSFSPYVHGYDPNTGPHPPHILIDELLTVVVTKLGFRCIMTYGVLNGLDYIFEAAKIRDIKVIAIIWLDTDTTVNTQSINLGIQRAKEYPDTIIRISCGSEVQTRHGASIAGPIIQDCITRLRAAQVLQPITSIDTWWVWCNEISPCQQRPIASNVDWIGINIFAWWENKFSGLFPCIPASEAAQFHMARFQDVINRYPNKTVIMTEFGWPVGPDGYSEINQYTGQHCGVASAANQHQVIEETLKRANDLNLSISLFQAFQEDWKSEFEGAVGPYWGVCAGIAPYNCTFPYGLRYRNHLPSIQR